jgi:hypothetical protein
MTSPGDYNNTQSANRQGHQCTNPFARWRHSQHSQCFYAYSCRGCHTMHAAGHAGHTPRQLTSPLYARSPAHLGGLTTHTELPRGTPSPCRSRNNDAVTISFIFARWHNRSLVKSVTFARRRRARAVAQPTTARHVIKMATGSRRYTPPSGTVSGRSGRHFGSHHFVSSGGHVGWGSDGCDPDR